MRRRQGTVRFGQMHVYDIGLLAIHDAHDSGSEPDLTARAGRPPTLHGKIDSAAVAGREAARGAGAGRIP